MANQIQATVYQIDGNPLPSPIQISFLTSDIMMKTSYLSTISEVNTAITYYPNSSNLLQEQVFYVQENASDLVVSANEGGTTQIYTTIHEIDGDPLIPNGVSFSFPANAISIWPSINEVTGVNSFIEFKNKRYYSSDTEADLKAQANVNNALPYKVYTALLTQSGGYDEQIISSGSVTQGVIYLVIDNDTPGSNWDFSNVGGPIYPYGGYFVATNSDTPISYFGATVKYNTGAPVVTVLENTIGNVYFTFQSDGQYQAKCLGAFPQEKTYVYIQPPVPDEGYATTYWYDADSVAITTQDGSKVESNDIMYNTSFEIRVYN